MEKKHLIKFPTLQDKNTKQARNRRDLPEPDRASREKPQLTLYLILKV